MVASATDGRESGLVKMDLRGAVADFTRFRGRECLISGARGTGKTWGILCWFIVLMQHYPGMRLLLLRKTRASMTDTILVTWENILVAIGLGHVCEGAGRANRTHYTFPNGCEVIVKGLDEPQRLRSGGFDMVYLNEGVEAEKGDWDTIISGLRPSGLQRRTPWRMAVMDCNPDAPTHWIRGRVESGHLKEFVSVHKDNPAFWDEQKQEWTAEGRAYMDNLESLTGVNRLRFLKGLWVAAEGAVYQDSWDAATHRIDPDRVPKELVHYAAVDWGYRHPGVISVYGVDKEGVAYRVREIYRPGKTLYWWHSQAKRLAQDYDIQAWVCDSAQPQHIQQWNLSGLYAVPSDKGPNSIIVRVRLVESALAKKSDGKASLYFVRGATGWYDDSSWSDGAEPYDPSSLALAGRELTDLEWLEGGRAMPAPKTRLGDWIPGRDEGLARENRPCCTEDEFYVYSWPKTVEGRPVKEVPVPEFDDGISACGYLLRYLQTGSMPVGLTAADEIEPYYDPAVEAMWN